VVDAIIEHVSVRVVRECGVAVVNVVRARLNSLAVDDLGQPVPDIVAGVSKRSIRARIPESASRRHCIDSLLFRYCR
jgi:hypothetical protein